MDVSGRPHAESTADLESHSSRHSSHSSSSSRRWSRRQRIEEILASCSNEVLRLERGAAREAAAAEHATRLIAARSSIQAKQSAGAPAPSSPLSQPLASHTQTSPGNDFCGECTLPEISPKAVAVVESPQDTEGTRHPLVQKRASATSIATELLRLLARDNTIMESNIQDYDVALSKTLEEVVRLRGEVRQLESARIQKDQLRKLLQHEMQVRTQLRNQNAQLLNQHHNLLSGIRLAAEAHDGYESGTSAVINGLISENISLRRLLSSVEGGSFEKTTEAQEVGSHRASAGTASSPAVFSGGVASAA